MRRLRLWRIGRLLRPAAWQGSRLGNRLIANVAAIGVLAALAIFLTLSAMVWSGFGRLEDSELTLQADRAGALLDGLRQALAAHSRDWGVWDEADDYLARFGPGFEARHVNPDAFANAQAQGMAYVNFDGRARAFVFGDHGRARPDLAAALLAEANTPALRADMAHRVDRQFFVRFDGGLYLLGLAQVRRSYRARRATGYVVFLNRIEPRALAQGLQTPVAITPAVPARGVAIAKQGGRATVAVPVLGRDGRAIAMLRFVTPRRMMAAGMELRDLMFVATLAQLLAMLLVLKQRIDLLVLDPVRRLQRQVETFRAHGERSPPPRARDDELGRVQSDFHALTTEVLALRDRLEAQSFALGRHQSTAGLIHNIRNSLSPVHVILSTLERHLARPVPPEAARALAELAQPATPPERRARLAAYLGVVHATFGADQQRARDEAEAADRHLAAALDAIHAGQADPRGIDHGQRCDLAPLLDQAALAGRFVRDAAISVTIACPPGLAVRGNRVLLGQVLENLVTNAVEAIVGRGGAGTIAIVAAVADARVRITLTDDGEGFAAECGPRLFARGYSTRSAKPGGLGLHWCANTVAAMGGRIALASPGPGQGASATVELEPYRATRAAA